MYRGKFSWERAFIFWSLKHPLLAFYIKLHDPGTLTPHHILFHLSNMIYWSHATHKRASARFKNNLTISIRMTVSREQAHVCYQCERSLLSDSLLAPLPPPFFFLFFSFVTTLESKISVTNAWPAWLLRRATAVVHVIEFSTARGGLLRYRDALEEAIRVSALSARRE